MIKVIGYEIGGYEVTEYIEEGVEQVYGFDTEEAMLDFVNANPEGALRVKQIRYPIFGEV